MKSRVYIVALFTSDLINFVKMFVNDLTKSSSRSFKIKLPAPNEQIFTNLVLSFDLLCFFGWVCQLRITMVMEVLDSLFSQTHYQIRTYLLLQKLQNLLARSYCQFSHALQQHSLNKVQPNLQPICYCASILKSNFVGISQSKSSSFSPV